ncbi:plasmid mobilization protein [Gluconobacter japonicus]|uniref:plasmid mobilization protein n=1 Tax=Gluconobacter japonicus TaxID=376620 RepID=UPI0039E73DD6
MASNLATVKRRDKHVGPRAGTPIKVQVTEEERAVIFQTAETCNMSVSALLRQLGLGYRPRSISDLLTQRELMRLRGEVARLCDLLKLEFRHAPKQVVTQPSAQALIEMSEATLNDIRGFLADFHEMAETFAAKVK